MISRPVLDLREVAAGMCRRKTWEDSFPRWHVDVEGDGCDVAVAHECLTDRVDTVVPVSEHVCVTVDGSVFGKFEAL
jgi:hypothetical protein